MNELEIELEAARALVKQAEALEKLHKNKAFKDIVLGWFDEATTFNDLANNPQLSAEAREGARAQLVGISALKQYFSGIYLKGNSASNAIESLEEELSGE